MGAFPVITAELQQSFERAPVPGVPEICGYLGRACYQLGKAEGCNRALCYGCPLAELAKKNA